MRVADKIGMHCVVSGKVQGVWFRAGTKTEADKRNITGWAMNLSDGRVEVAAFGERQHIAELINWLKVGPELASVTDVSCQEIPWQNHPDFKTK